MSRSDLKYWPILSLLESEFVNNLRMVMVYGNLGDEALLVTYDGSVFGVGHNTSGCLGTGDNQSTLHPRKINILSQKGIKTFAHGNGPHVLALTVKGEVYSWGHNVFSELGNGSSNHNSSPARVDINLADRFVIEIACGSHHSLALTDDGEVYSWGQNSCGQVGNCVSTHQNTPRKVIVNIGGMKVIKIACGQTSSLALTNYGEIFGWGNDSLGQLGTGNYTNKPTPHKALMPVGVVIEKIACGFSHTLALSDEGDLYVWGGNAHGQLGLGNKINTVQPTKLTVPEMGRVLDIAAVHYSHISIAISEGGKVFMWGHCKGQSVSIPVQIPFTNLHEALASFATPSVMHAPLILYHQEETSILDSLRQAFDDPSNSDLTIEVQGKPIHVHKAILKIRCQYFKSMFQEHWSENNQSLIQQDDFSYEVYKSFLKYIYTDEVDLPPENALELLYLATAYLEPQLKRRCIQIIKQGITVANVASLYSTAIEYTSEELEDFCFTFAMNHMTAVIQTPNFAKLDQTTMKTFVIRAAKMGAFKT